MKMTSKRRRRATILLMVVSLLALLFVIVTGFLSLARVDRGMLADIREADLAEAIVDDISDGLVASIADQLRDDSGRVLGGGDPESYSAEETAGYRCTNWLAALEPVWDPTATDRFNWGGTWTVLEQLRWPAATSLDDGVRQPHSFAIYELMQDYDPGDYNPRNPYFRLDDVRWNARNPFMDADGDGVPDTHLLLVGSATEAANAAAGTPVQLPRFVSSNPGAPDYAFTSWCIPPLEDPFGNLRGEKWQRYTEQARYEAAVRVISHGGMVTLDSPTLYDGSEPYTPVNRGFVVDLFDATRHRDDPSMSGLYDPDSPNEHRLFDALHASASAIEPLLRRRFLLPGAPIDEYGRRAVPGILGELQGELGGGFPNTFLPSFESGSPGSVPLNNWQRINLAAGGGTLGPRYYWARSAALDATAFDVPGDNEAKAYDRRHFISTVNYSDELARKQEADEPSPSQTQPLDLGTYRGELKFYLGEVSKAFVELGSGQYAYDYYRGSVIIERLATLFYEMLSSYEWDADATVLDADAIDDEQAVSRRQQALMLAVNTVAFATPRDTQPGTRGYIDVVNYIDAGRSLEYAGYAPQPFFSEAIAYNEQEDPDDPDEPDKLAIAVELYNPNDLLPGFDVSDPNSDPFALYLPQFTIAVNGANPNNQATFPPRWASLGAEANGFDNTRLAGRSFITLVIKDATDTTAHLDSYAGNRTFTLAVGTADPDNERVKLDLWRQGRYYDSATQTAYTRWFHVDRIEVKYPEKNQWTSRYRDLAKATIDPLYADATLGGQPYFPAVGDASASEYRWARWSVVTAWDDDDTSEDEEGFPHNEAEGTGEPRAGALQTALGLNGQGAPAQFERNQPNVERTEPTLPMVPLLTMNAGPGSFDQQPLHERLNDLPMFGNFADLRPRSFPTVGFLLFVPRFAHVHQVMLPGGWTFPNQPAEIMAVRSMSQTLEKERRCQDYDGYRPWVVPADFGHMPVFDNKQGVDGGSYFGAVGRVPWGLLVFDYFTTLNPVQDRNADGEPDVDPLRVPGRINVNTAPWYVLSKLPLLGPLPDTGVLPIIPAGPVTPAFPSPSFWEPMVGVLCGVVNPGQADNEYHRLLATDYADSDRPYMPYAAPDADSTGRYRLGAWLAQSAAAYRDGLQYVASIRQDPSYVYADSYQRNPATGIFGTYPYRNTTLYGAIRGKATAANGRASEFGFVTVGELLNVKGFDSSRHDELPPFQIQFEASAETTALGRGDYVKAVSLLALLDTQYLTTRSNTFTIYASVMDREEPQASVRSQVTVDRSNLLPRLTYAYSVYDPVTRQPVPADPTYPLNPEYAAYPLAPLLLDANGDTVAETPVRMTSDDAEPQIIARERVGYFNARYDD
jgi:hypothetical protein